MYRSHRVLRRLGVALPTLAALTLGFASSALAASNSPAPTLPNWGVFTSCGSGQNCAEIRATAEDARTNTVYAGGSFAQAVSPTGGASRPYHNLVALNENTGAVDTGFAAHTFNGEVLAIAVNQAAGLVYVGGNFTAVDGSPTAAGHVAAFNATTGRRDTNFRVGTNGPVHALLYNASRDLLYVGGRFTSINSTGRVRLAGVNPASGSVSTSFRPPTISWTATSQHGGTEVRALALGADSSGNPALYVGGHFDHVGSARHVVIARVNPATGAPDNGFSPPLDGSTADNLLAVDDLAWASSSILVAQAGHVNRGYRITAAGHRIWTQKPDGDMQAVAVSGGSVYFGGHFTCDATGRGSCLKGGSGGQTRVHIVAVDLSGGAIDSAFAPAMSPTIKPYFFGVWSLSVASNGALWAGGQFAKVVTGGQTYPRPKLAVFPPR
jgi:hypothetical protein